jgi:hypothetical protein
MNKPNIIFIVVDALRWKNLDCYGYPKNISPNIDEISKKGKNSEAETGKQNLTLKKLDLPGLILP